MGPGGSTHIHCGPQPSKASGQVTELSEARVRQRRKPSESVRAATEDSECFVTRSVQGTGKWG